MRGTLQPAAPAPCLPGIIPAYAGNTLMCHDLFCEVWDHPRVCGEHHGVRFGLLYSLGSSPRMRGTPKKANEKSKAARIIPAYAGNTRGVRPQRQHVRDHPRVCGEHCIVGGVQNVGEGSSPRMRGTLRTTTTSTPHVGIIPAYAGNTGVLKTYFIQNGDHPRVCGEHTLNNEYA